MRLLMRRSFGAGALALALLVGGCGGATSSANGASAGASPSASTAQQQPAGRGGARIDKPFQAQITSAQCTYLPSARPGFAGFLFPADAPNPASATLGFTLGPNPDAGQDAASNPPYTGAGRYTHILLAASSADGKQSFSGMGTVVVNADKQSGTFATDDGSASGSFDCGRPIG